jgi:hypothetical protein
MAKRKAARRKAVASRRTSKGRSRPVAKKASARKKSQKKTARRSAKKAARPRMKVMAKKAVKKAAKKSARTAPRAAARKPASGTAMKRSSGARSIKKIAKRAAPVVGKVAKVAAPMLKKKKAAPAAKLPVRTAPALNRERRVIQDDDVVPSPPSSLDLDRTASAVRSGRRELRERYNQHTETSPALTAGDVDADWESAYAVGDEAPGGDNPTPDQDVVDDIGRAVGIEYEDNEELKGEAKVIKRDKNRWELDPASSDDWDDR